MVLDFSDIKRTLSTWIDESLDHRMILHRDDPAVPALEQLGEPLFLMDVNPTAENIAQMIFEQAQRQGLPVIEVTLWETPRCFATYAISASPSRPTSEPPPCAQYRIAIARASRRSL